MRSETGQNLTSAAASAVSTMGEQEKPAGGRRKAFASFQGAPNVETAASSGSIGRLT